MAAAAVGTAATAAAAAADAAAAGALPPFQLPGQLLHPSSGWGSFSPPRAPVVASPPPHTAT